MDFRAGDSIRIAFAVKLLVMLHGNDRDRGFELALPSEVLKSLHRVLAQLIFFLLDTATDARSESHTKRHSARVGRDNRLRVSSPES